MIKGSIRQKLLLSMLVAVLIPFLVSNIITYYSTSDVMKEYQVQTNHSLIESGSENLAYYLSELDQLSLLWVYDENLLDLLHAESLNFGEQSILEYEMKNVLYQESDILRVQFQMESSGLSYYASRSSFYNKEQETLSLDEKFNNNTFRIFETVELDGRTVLAVHRKIVDVPQGDLLGYLSIYVSINELNTILNRLHGEEEEVFVSFGSTSSRIHTPEEVKENKELYFEKIQSINEKDTSQGMEKADMNNVEMSIFYDKNSYQDIPISLVKFVPSTLIMENVTKPLSYIQVVQVIAIILIALFIYLVSYSLTKPIQRLNKTIGSMESGTFIVNQVPDKPRKDELGVLERRFNEMVRRLNVLINKEYRLQLEVTTAQLKMLQAQINPHFLFNTLQSIGTIAIKNNVPEVYERLISLSTLFRYSMDVHTGSVPLKSEVENVQEYLYLQEGRFHERLTHKIECEEEIFHVQVPKMILQPLVENSIIHGLERNNQDCEIKIEASLEKNYLNLAIVDNGEGFSSAKIEEIRNSYRNREMVNEANAGIGLLNVLFRLHFEYGDAFNWSIKSKPFERTAIQLMIPLQEEEDGE